MPPRRPRSTPWGDALRSLLNERGLSRTQLARIARLDRATVAHALRGGHVTTDTLQKLASALGVDLPELFRPAGENHASIERRDRVVMAVLRELSDEVAHAVAVEMARRRRTGGSPPLRGERKLPFIED